MSNEKHIQDLKEIRSMMEKSTRFLSLSGWSGIMAGVYALIGAYLAQDHIEPDPIQGWYDKIPNLIIISMLVIAFSLVTGFFLTYQKATKGGQAMMSKAGIRMAIYTGFPIFIGGIFSFAMLYHKTFFLIAPTMLIFYGLGLINGSKYTLNDIRVLGVANVVLGILAAFFTHYGLYFWAGGFGVGHIIYGTYMWMRYEKNA